MFPARAKRKMERVYTSIDRIIKIAGQFSRKCLLLSVIFTQFLIIYSWSLLFVVDSWFPSARFFVRWNRKKKKKEMAGKKWRENESNIFSHLLPAFENTLDFESGRSFSRYSGISRFRKARWILSPPFFFDVLFCDTETCRMRIRDEHESWKDAPLPLLPVPRAKSGPLSVSPTIFVD